MNAAYTILGKYFEYLNDNCDYIKWSQYLHITLKKYSKISLISGLDIGCGNGFYTRFFTDLGIDMTAIDCSESMLTVAREQAKQYHHNTQYISANILEYTAPAQKSFAIAINDCFNYIPPMQLSTALQNIANSLQKGGILIFDISTAYKFQEELDGQVFCDDKEDIAYIWHNTLTKEYLDMHLTFFIKEADGRYKREEEWHRQYIHKKANILKELHDSGFKVLECSGHLGDKKDKLRANFICEKL